MRLKLHVHHIHSTSIVIYALFILLYKYAYVKFCIALKFLIKSCNITVKDDRICDNLYFILMV